MGLWNGVLCTFLYLFLWVFMWWMNGRGTGDDDMTGKDGIGGKGLGENSKFWVV
jgi:hypothetical protein